MKKLIVLPFVLPFVLLAGCGTDVAASCQDYVDAWSACIDEAYADDTSGIGDTYSASLDAACTAYEDSALKGDAAKTAADLLTCYADTIDAGDCSTPEAYGATVASITTDCL